MIWKNSYRKTVLWPSCFSAFFSALILFSTFWAFGRVTVNIQEKKKKVSEKNLINVKKQIIKSRHEIYLRFFFVCISINCVIIFILRISFFSISKSQYENSCIDCHYRPYKSQLEWWQRECIAACNLKDGSDQRRKRQ